MTEDNGPLEVIPGSHKGPLFDHWHDGVFTGTVSEDVVAGIKSHAVACYGPAGSACLMHTRLLHGSAPNLSRAPRTLFISVFTAEDAIPCSPNPMPTSYQGLLVRGEQTGRIRSIPFEMRLPQLPTTASFFDQQAKHDDGTGQAA